MPSRSPSLGSRLVLVIALIGACSADPWAPQRSERLEPPQAEPISAPARALSSEEAAAPPAAAPSDAAARVDPVPAAPAFDAAAATAAAAAAAAAAEVSAAAAAVAADAAAGAAPIPDPVSAPRELFAVHREVFVLAAPSAKAKKIGYLRAGARVLRGERPAAHDGCAGGFYRVAPEGFVCAGPGVKLEPGGPVQELLALRPDRLSPLPYVYARAGGDAPPFYTKLPSALEQRQIEPERTRSSKAKRFAELSAQPVPAWLAAGKPTPTSFGGARDAASVSVGRALPDSSFAVLGIFDHGTRRFGLVDDLTLVPLDRTERVTGSDFHGLALDGANLPVVFVMRRGAQLYAGDPRAGLKPARALAYREAVPIRGRVTVGGVRYLESADGQFLRDEQLLEIEPLAAPPRWAKAGRRWIHVSIGKQSLVAYEGARPVYVTLVSTGVDGAGDPETTRSTVRGQFLVHTKHVTAAMNSTEAGDEYDLRDVPWVQYFSDNYAFHAAYWHDAFGAPKSHGCINLSPRDARFLFQFTDPPVPQGWHGAFSLRDGTLVDITP